MVLPYTRAGVIGGVMLGLGRALGETMAVTFVISNAYNIGAIVRTWQPIASALANEFNEASDPAHLSALITPGLTLFVLSFIVPRIAPDAGEAGNAHEKANAHERRGVTTRNAEPRYGGVTPTIRFTAAGCGSTVSTLRCRSATMAFGMVFC